MKDLNFFEPYIEKKQFKINKSMILYSLVGIICIGLLFFAAINQIQIMRLNSQVNELETIARDPKIVEKVSHIQEKETEMAIFRTEVEDIQYMDEIIESKEIVSDEFIREITSNLPKDTFLTSITIYEDAIGILGVANDKWSIAEFARGLENMEGLYEVYISSISSQEDKFNFNLDISLVEDIIPEEEDIDGEDEEEETEDQVSN